MTTTPIGPTSLATHADRAALARGDILTMTTVAGSGHPGGSLSTLDLLLAVLERSDLRPESHRELHRDHVVVSHGHVSPAVYAALAQHGFMDRDDLVATFRLAGSPYQGHVERYLPGVDWTTGNLGQGLAAACGIALALKKGGDREHVVYALGSDGEQAKGQIAEARRFAVHHGLDNVVVLLDVNGLQISGLTADIMAVPIEREYAAAGWRTSIVDGHDAAALRVALDAAGPGTGTPLCILGRTVMGKGVPFIEHDPAYHGKALSSVEYRRGMRALGLEPMAESAHARRAHAGIGVAARAAATHDVSIRTGERRVYPLGTDTDMRSAWGQALVDLGELNANMLVFDCDLSESVKTKAFAARFPERFIQAGVQEHATATIAGAASTSGQLVFWAGYAAFVIDEVYNQQRLNGINEVDLKVVATHCGIDVGEDGPTHQIVDTVGLLRNLPDTTLLLPADPNQADAMTRYMAGTRGRMFMLMGRSKTPVLEGAAGVPCFGSDYAFTPGAWDVLRTGRDGLVVSWGAMSARALAAADRAADAGIDVGVISIPSLAPPTKDSMATVGSPPWVITVEDHWPDTGVGAWFALTCLDRGVPVPRLERMGATALPFSGAAKDVYGLMGLDADGILARIVQMQGS